MKKYRYTKSQQEADEWLKSAMDAGLKRAEGLVKGVGMQNLHMNSFMCGVEWVLKHRPIPRAFRKVKNDDNN